ncbi:GNAT family N-acetyltransferase [Planctomycetota bacterium]
MNTRSSTGIVFFEKRLNSPPPELAIDSFRVRQFDFSSTDTEHWLRIHNRSSEPLTKGRVWTDGDFNREFASLIANRRNPSTAKERLWFVEPAEASPVPIGTISMQPRDSTQQSIGVINWLAVLPAYRRKGIATLLLNIVERSSWEHDMKTIGLSTLATWAPAVAFYDSQGFKRR